MRFISVGQERRIGRNVREVRDGIEIEKHGSMIENVCSDDGPFAKSKDRINAVFAVPIMANEKISGSDVKKDIGAKTGQLPSNGKALPSHPFGQRRLKEQMRLRKEVESLLLRISNVVQPQQRNHERDAEDRERNKAKFVDGIVF